MNFIQQNCCTRIAIMLAGNVRVLLQMGDLLTSRSELQLGFVILPKIRTFAWLYASAETTADSELQPIVSTSSLTCSNTIVSGCFRSKQTYF
jgi:hypothetical protein